MPDAINIQTAGTHLDWQGPRRAFLGNAAEHIDLDDAPELASNSANQSLVAVDDALQQLERVDPRKAQVVELKFFGGLSVEETAEVLKVSP